MKLNYIYNIYYFYIVKNSYVYIYLYIYEFLVFFLFFLLFLKEFNGRFCKWINECNLDFCFWLIYGDGI